MSESSNEEPIEDLEVQSVDTNDYHGQHVAPEPNGFLADQNYTLFKNLSLYLLPALAAAYYGLGLIWGFPKTEEVLASVAVLETLIGTILRISKARYDASGVKYDGTILLSPDVENGLTDMAVSFNAEAIANKKEIVVKVQER